MTPRVEVSPRDLFQLVDGRGIPRAWQPWHAVPLDEPKDNAVSATPLAPSVGQTRSLGLGESELARLKPAMQYGDS